MCGFFNSLLARQRRGFHRSLGQCPRATPQEYARTQPTLKARFMQKPFSARRILGDQEKHRRRRTFQEEYSQSLKHEKSSKKTKPVLSDRPLALRLARKRHGFWFLFSARSADFSPAAAGSAGWPSLHGGFRGEIPPGLPSPTACSRRLLKNPRMSRVSSLG